MDLSAARKAQERLMRAVYGDWESPSFPRPLPESEAGPSPCGQRRYLWTDAFAVLNFVSMAHRAESPECREALLGAAGKLVSAVHECLGRPRSPEFPMAPDGSGGYKGLRIGKEQARKQSDAGMSYDGMYWHYLDKWMFALARLAEATGSRETAERAVRLVRQVHPHFAVSRGDSVLGVYWKTNVDLTPIRGLERVGPSSDALTGWLVYRIVQRATAAGSDGSPPLAEEEAQLRVPAMIYATAGGLRATDDPLGYGLQWWKAQWLRGAQADELRRELRSGAASAMSQRHLSLPFRLYGAVIGARLSRDAEVAARAEEALAALVDREERQPVGAPHSGINKVMLATALDPWALEARPGEEVTV
eukprot:TRINITY_DN11081_c0_g1_i3.p1 TRINITY_DN11081_c0_g1~~TRINITY_DN11081_c0_g1_i3.p1  ORF type:complete len:362 (+),score=97.10 TRINITY_DN11081_c0_g1_i3:81-1166(+)